MNAQARKFVNRLWPRGVFKLVDVAEVNTIKDGPRDMTGLFSTLSEGRKVAALSYRGDECHGDASYVKK